MTIYNSTPASYTTLSLWGWISGCFFFLNMCFNIKKKKYYSAFFDFLFFSLSVWIVVSWQYRDFLQRENLLEYFMLIIPFFSVWFGFTVYLFYDIVKKHNVISRYFYSKNTVYSLKDKIYAWVSFVVFELACFYLCLDIGIFSYFKSTEETSNKIIIEEQINQENPIDFKAIIEKNKFNSQTSKSADFRRKSCDFPTP